MLLRGRDFSEQKIVLYGAIRIALIIVKFTAVQKCLTCYCWTAKRTASLDRADRVG